MVGFTEWMNLARALGAYVNPANASGEQAHQAFGGEVGRKEVRILQAGGADQAFGGQIAAADGAFHGGRPTRGGPISSEKNSGPHCGCGGAVGVDSRARRIGGMQFLDDSGL